MSDETDDAVFVMFDTDVNYLIGKQYFVMVSASKVWIWLFNYVAGKLMYM